MHSPKSLDSKPLRYHSHLCNNFNAVAVNSESLQNGFDQYMQLLDEMIKSYTTQMKTLWRLSNFSSFQEFNETKSMFNTLRHFQGMLQQHAGKHELFCKKFNEHLGMLKQSRVKYGTRVKQLLDAHKKLEKRREDMIANVNKTKAQYYKTASRAEQQPSTPRESTPMNQLARGRAVFANRELKVYTSTYLSSVDGLMGFLPKYNDELAQILQGIEQTDRNVMTSVKDSMTEWLDSYEQLFRCILDDVVELRNTVATTDVQSDIEEFISKHRLDPDPDPTQVFKFQMYESASPASPRSHSPRSHSPRRMAGPLASLPFVSNNQPLSPRVPRGIDMTMVQNAEDKLLAYLQSLDFMDPGGQVQPACTVGLADAMALLPPRAGRMALASALRKQSGTATCLSETSFAEATQLLAQALDEASDQSDTFSACLLVHSAIPFYKQSGDTSPTNSFRGSIDLSEQEDGTPRSASPASGQCYVVTAVKDHPMVLAYSLWYDTFFAQLGFTSTSQCIPETVTEEQWLQSIQGARCDNRPPAEEVATALGGYLSLLSQLQIDGRILRQLFSQLRSDFHFTAQQQQDVQSSVPAIQLI
eukprot:TRINITY_DN3718_c0_g1_i1.p1 TRINITY_DN3718_c0_g1~~TRINITY_DN3718_c0_g1_i1.p1  ORF type:complete len:587 (-),score=112.06 TRINITY_DN3718_c0_g1_i1:2732-4492(-)